MFFVARDQLCYFHTPGKHANPPEVRCGRERHEAIGVASVKVSVVAVSPARRSIARPKSSSFIAPAKGSAVNEIHIDAPKTKRPEESHKEASLVGATKGLSKGYA